MQWVLVNVGEGGIRKPAHEAELWFPSNTKCMELCFNTCIPSLYGTQYNMQFTIAASVAGFWLAARSKWEMLVALKFCPGCVFFLFHHETLTFYTYLPRLMVAMVQEPFFFIACYLVAALLHQICVTYIYSIFPIYMYICMVLCMYVCSAVLKSALN